MKSNTQVCVAVRNIGDANDSGEFFEGELKDAFMWLVTRLGAITMAKRIAVGFGRDKAGAAAAIEIKRGKGLAMDVELQDQLDRLFAGESLEDIEAGNQQVESRDPRDTWIPPA